MLAHDVEEALAVDAGGEAGDAFEFVEGASRVAEPAPAHLGDGYAERGDDGHDGERGLIAHAAGGMLVDFDALEPAQVHHIARMLHGEGERGCLARVHAAEEDGHEERRRLIVGNLACYIALDEVADFLGGERAAVALVLDDVVHAHGRLLLRAAGLGVSVSSRAGCRRGFPGRSPGAAARPAYRTSAGRGCRRG